MPVGCPFCTTGNLRVDSADNMYYIKCINTNSTHNTYGTCEDREKFAGISGGDAACRERRIMIILDYRDARPLYEQIVDKFQTLILKGVLEPNSKMPSVRSLAVELSINPNTIQRAYSELERTGFIYAVKGRGNFVAYDDKLRQVRCQEIFEKLDALKQEALEFGITKEELVARLLEDKKKEGEHD